ncbi:MAG: hypothetical protein E7012_03960 [Alphaproteobacteria bacterium]|nr:hypothetical protein [Alphaproteobacteria bacterium]
MQKIKYKKLTKNSGGIVWAKRSNVRIDIAVRILKYTRENWDLVVWICGAGYVDNTEYRNKIMKKSSSIYKKIKFFSYEDISLTDESYIKMFDLLYGKRIFCIMDGSLNIKNMFSARTKRMILLRNKFKYRLLLSELPIYRAIRDIYAQMMFVGQNAINKTETQFLQQYMPYYTDDFEVQKRWSVPKSEKKVIQQVKPYVVFCDFSDNLKINHYDYTFRLNDAEKKVYKEDKINFLNNYPHAEYLKIIQRFQYYYTICKEKVDKLRILLNQVKCNNEKVVIYLKYLSEVKFLRESGVLKNHKFVIMTGMNDKKRAVNMFENGYNVMICTYKVDIPKLFLKECCNLIYFSQTFDYKDKIYALSRFDNDEKMVLNVYDFWVNTRLENLIKDNLKRKKAVLQNIFKIMSNKEVCDL